MRRRAPGLAAALGLALVLGGCSPGGSSPPGGETREEAGSAEGVIVAVGDSLTAGLGVPEEGSWPARLERMLRREGYRWKVVNAGVSGETSSGARRRIDWILRLQPDIVVLETGANDGFRGVPPGLVRENIDAILGTLGQRGVVVVLAGMRMVPNMGERYTEEFDGLYPELARAHGVLMVPFFLEGVAGDPSLNQPDGIHPTSEGYAVVTRVLYPYVVEAIARARAQGD